MTFAAFLSYSLVLLVVMATPGPTVLLALSNGSRHGLRPALSGMAGAMLGDYLIIGAVGLGLGALLAASQLLFGIVKWAGVAYLAWLGLMLLRSGGHAGHLDRAAETAPSRRDLFAKSLAVALSNPKAYILYAAFLPQFVVTSAPQAPQYPLLATIAAATNFVVMFLYAAMGSQLAKVLKSASSVWIDRFCGATLLALAGSLAFYRRAA